MDKYTLLDKKTRFYSRDSSEDHYFSRMPKRGRYVRKYGRRLRQRRNSEFYPTEKRSKDQSSFGKDNFERKF